MFAEQYGLIYLLRNTVNGKCYVGQTTASLEHRFGQHISSNNKMPICRALKKYGRESFTKEVIFFAFNKDALDYAEIALIEEHRASRPHGYNIKGGGSYGKHHDETKKKLSDASLGKKFSMETRAKIAATRIGKTLSPETKEKVLNALRGRVLSQATKDKISASLTGRKRPTEVVEKMSRALRGRKWSAERCAEWSVKMKGKKRSPQARENIRLGWVRRKAAAQSQLRVTI